MMKCPLPRSLECLHGHAEPVGEKPIPATKKAIVAIDWLTERRDGQTHHLPLQECAEVQTLSHLLEARGNHAPTTKSGQ
jgi:hypothetical protein